MAMITTGAPRIYLTVTEEDLEQVLFWINAMRDCALRNVTRDVHKLASVQPITTTFRFPLPLCMAVEIEKPEEG